MVPVHKHDKKYLRVYFKGILYEYNCLCFGLNCALRVFTKLLKPIISFHRQKGHISVVYLDDFLLMGDAYDKENSSTAGTLKMYCKL
nr:unnamed protein product [Callosobruchus chinensis]